MLETLIIFVLSHWWLQLSSNWASFVLPHHAWGHLAISGDIFGCRYHRPEILLNTPQQSTQLKMSKNTAPEIPWVRGSHPLGSRERKVSEHKERRASVRSWGFSCHSTPKSWEQFLWPSANSNNDTYPAGLLSEGNEKICKVYGISLINTR